MISVRTMFGVAAGVCALSGGIVLAQQSQSGTSAAHTSNRMSTADRRFMIKAAQGGLAEVELGRLAAERGGNQAVKEFGQRMVDDHSKANDELMQVAAQKQVTLPKSLDAKDKALKDRLSKLSGAAFDQSYIDHMVKDHQHDVADFQREASRGTDPEVKGFASKTLPTLKMHLSMSEEIKNGKTPTDLKPGSGGTSR